MQNSKQKTATNSSNVGTYKYRGEDGDNNDIPSKSVNADEEDEVSSIRFVFVSYHVDLWTCICAVFMTSSQASFKIEIHLNS